jgi:hypothetical protein
VRGAISDGRPYRDNAANPDLGAPSPTLK